MNTRTCFSMLLLLVVLAATNLGCSYRSYHLNLSLNSNRMYTSNDNNISVAVAADKSDWTSIDITFRAWRITDPVDFLLAQQNLNSPDFPSPFMSLEDRMKKRPAGAGRYQLAGEWSLHQQGGRYNGNVNVPVTRPGLYLIEATFEGRRATTALIISDVQLLLKQSGSSFIAFATDKGTGQRITGMRLMCRSFATGQFVESATDDNGVALLDSPYPTSGSFLIVGEKDGHVVVASDQFYNAGRDYYRVHVQTDRPVYRPEQRVYYRGILRRLAGDSIYIPVTNVRGQVEVLDSKERMIARDSVSLSANGTFSGDVLLASKPPLGTYGIRVRIGADTSRFAFAVEEYKKPEFDVKVTTERTRYVPGDSIHGSIAARYYFGSPVTEGTVQLSVYRMTAGGQQASIRPASYSSAQQSDATGRFMLVSVLKGRLDSNGHYHFAWPTARGVRDAHLYRFRAEVTDNSRMEVAGEAQAVVTAGDITITARGERNLYMPGENIAFSVAIGTFNGTSRAVRFRADAVRGWGGAKMDTIWSGDAVTDASGRATVRCPVTAPGPVTLYVRAVDSAGHESYTSASTMVAGDDIRDYQLGTFREAQLLIDRSTYTAGDTVIAVVLMPVDNADVLVTLEGPAIHAIRVERVARHVATVRIPITAGHIAASSINVAMLVGGNVYSTSQPVTITPSNIALRLEVKPDKQVYKPGEHGSVRLRALNHAGHPVAGADIALSIVDEAIYAVRPDMTPSLAGHFYTGWPSTVSTTAPKGMVFYGGFRYYRSRSGGGGGGGMGEESNPLDLAVGGGGLDLFPSMTTYAEAAGRPSGPLSTSQRIQSSTTVSGQVSEPVAAAERLPAPPLPVTRTTFEDLAFWQSSIVTDKDGYAQLDITFPDNITAWRMTARGITARTEVGEATAYVEARKDLFVRMETPRFLVNGDRVTIATIVHNYTADAQQVGVSMRAENLKMSSQVRTVTVPAGGEQRIDWDAATVQSGDATVTVSASAGSASDGMQTTLPVLADGIPGEATAAAQTVRDSGRAEFRMTLPSSYDPHTIGLTVTAAPSLSGAVIGSLDNLIGYPYGCAEQTMSRFLPTVVVANILKESDIPFDPKRRAAIPAMVDSGLAKLYGYQHDDGGWGWWFNDETNPFMTAYIMYGLTTARRAGFEISADRYQRGERALLNLISSRKGGGGYQQKDAALDPTTEAYMLYVASYIAVGKPARVILDRITSLAGQEKLNSYAKALLSLAATATGQKAIASTLITALSSEAQRADSTASWTGITWEHRWQNDMVETSAFAVKALLHARGDQELMSKGLRWLMGQKRGNAWGSTRQTAMAIYTLVEFISHSTDNDNSGSLSITVNGHRVKEQMFTAVSPGTAEHRIELDGRFLHPGENIVTVERTGHGSAMISASIAYVATGKALVASDSGVAVSREYFTLHRESRGDRFVYTKQPFTGTISSGDPLLVKVHVKPKNSQEYFMIEDPLPAGCEVIANADDYEIEGERDYPGATVAAKENKWRWWYSDRTVRDEKIAFFASRLEPREYEVSYILKARIPGNYRVMPTVGSLVYFPQTRGNGEVEEMKIE